MSGSETDSTAKSKKAGRPADVVWQFFESPGVAQGLPSLLGSHNRLHRKCLGCNKTIKAATVVQGEDHLLSCRGGFSVTL